MFLLPILFLRVFKAEVAIEEPEKHREPCLFWLIPSRLEKWACRKAEVELGDLNFSFPTFLKMLFFFFFLPLDFS